MTTNWVVIFGPVEWEWITKLGSSYHDPEEKRVFWETVKAKKEADHAYSVFTDFPRDHINPPVSGKVNADDLRICREIIAMIEASNRKRKESDATPEQEKVTKEQQELGELIDLGAHQFQMCLWPRRKSSA